MRPVDDSRPHTWSWWATFVLCCMSGALGIALAAL